MPKKSTNGRGPSWKRLYEMAAPQGGYFVRKQAANAGYSPPLLEYHIREGRVERVARGTFRLTHFPPGDHEDLIMVWLWSERRGVFSHETALALHNLSDVLPAKKHLTLPTAWARRRFRIPSGVILHFADLGKKDIAWKGPIPVTTPLRSLADWAMAGVPRDLLNDAARQGTQRGLFARAELRAALDAARRAAEHERGAVE